MGVEPTLTYLASRYFDQLSYICIWLKFYQSYVIILPMIFILFGFSCWMILEYIIHRFLLHGTHINKTHNHHHNYPKDKSNIIISPFITILSSILYCILTYVSFGLIGMILSFSSFLLGYILYEVVHYKTHYSTSKHPIIKYLIKHHFNHHYKDNNKNFGVTTPILDYLLGTKI